VRKPLSTVTRPEAYQWAGKAEAQASSRLDGETRVIEAEPLHVTCTCPPGTGFGTYTQAVTVKRPAHMYPTERGDVFSVDRCILPLCRALWRQGIWTMASCCGHGKARPSVCVAPEHVSLMHALGYEATESEGSCFYVD